MSPLALEGRRGIRTWIGGEGRAAASAGAAAGSIASGASASSVFCSSGGGGSVLRFGIVGIDDIDDIALRPFKRLSLPA